MPNLTEIISSAVAVIALVVSFFAFRKTQDLEKYKSADTTLFELLRLNLEYPQFNNPEFTNAYTPELVKTDPKYQQYDIFAMMIWNFLDTLIDYYGSENLLDSPFSGVVYFWVVLHSKWYYAEGNNEYYSDEFKKIIEKLKENRSQEAQNVKGS